VGDVQETDAVTDGERLEMIRRLVAAHCRASASASVVPLGRGTDHESYLVDGRLVVRLRLAGDPATRAAGIGREAALLELVAEVSPLPVPRPAFVAPDDGCLAYERLEGVPMLGLRPAQRARLAERVAGEVGRLMRALADVDAARLDRLAPLDDTSPDELLVEAGENYIGIADAVPARDRAALEAFLDATAPPAASSLVFCHNDLGIEHVLVEPAAGGVTGIIDWSDAALADPARDLGLVFRDLGHAALHAALSGFGAPADDALRARARFHGRCALLEDLAFGLEEDRPEYVDKSLAGLAWAFSDDPPNPK
jgi:aminoglycoside phosphotransferase (APT) family kinase protein